MDYTRDKFKHSALLSVGSACYFSTLSEEHQKQAGIIELYCSQLKIVQNLDFFVLVELNLCASREYSNTNIVHYIHLHRYCSLHLEHTFNTRRCNLYKSLNVDNREQVGVIRELCWVHIHNKMPIPHRMSQKQILNKSLYPLWH